MVADSTKFNPDVDDALNQFGRAVCRCTWSILPMAGRQKYCRSS